jgi:hypothetical protein
MEARSSPDGLFVVRSTLGVLRTKREAGIFVLLADRRESHCMLLINLVALGACGLGFVAGWRAVRRGRLPSEVTGAQLSWKENPAPVIRYDTLGGFLIAFHALATMALCVLLTGSVNQAGESPLSMAFTSPADQWVATFVDLHDTQLQWLSLFIAAGSAGIGAFVFGLVLSFPFSRWCIRPVLVHLHPDGIIYGQIGRPWKDIVFYQIDTDRRLFKIYTHSPSKAPTFVLHPISQAMFSDVERILRDLLPGKQVDGAPTGMRRRWWRGLVLCLAMLLILLVSFWVYRYVAEWVWFLYVLVIMGLQISGRILLRI